MHIDQLLQFNLKQLTLRLLRLSLGAHIIPRIPRPFAVPSGKF